MRAIILAAVCVSSLLGQDGRTYKSETWGFLVGLPKGWTHGPTPPQSGALFAIALQASEGGGHVGGRIEVRKQPSGQDAATYLDKKVPRLEKLTSQYANIVRSQNRSAGRTLEIIAVDYVTKGRVYRLEQAVVIRDGLLFTVQVHAPKDAFDLHARPFGHVRNTFKTKPVGEETRRKRRLEQLAKRCGTRLGWVPTWDEAAMAAKREGKLILVYARRYGGFALSDRTLSGPLMDTNVVDLVRTRFVPWKLDLNQRPPFVVEGPYGLGRFTFGQALLVVSPQGRVLTEAHPMHAVQVDAFLRRAVRHLPAPRPPGKGPVSDAEWLVERGALEAALQALGDRKEGRAGLVRARILGRRMDGDGALRALSDDGGVAAAERVLERGRLLARMGRLDEARKALASVVAGSERRWHAEALFWLGLCGAPGKLHDAPNTWDRLVTEHPDDPFAWRAAAAMTGTTYRLYELLPSPRWPAAGVMADSAEPRPMVDRATHAMQREHAIAYLLQAQDANGAWYSGTDTRSPVAKWPHPHSMSVTALAIRALLPHREQPRVAKALDAATANLLARHAFLKRSPRPVHFMDYGVWLDACLLLAGADLLDAKVGDAEAVAAMMRDAVKDLHALQRPSGGFSYYISRSVDATEAPDECISFCTATVVRGLVRAREAGVTVPPQVFDGAVDALHRTRGSDGQFTYSVRGRQSKVGMPVGTAGNASRGPLCALALHRAGKGDLDGIRSSLRGFVIEHRVLIRQQRKTLMHTGPNGEGSHYLMFDYAMTAEAIASLPEAERRAFASVILSDLSTMRLVDGSYLGTPLLGRSFGAAMGVTALNALLPAP